MTVQINLVGSDFVAPFEGLNGKRRLRTSRNSLLRALVTVGHLPAFIAPPVARYRSEAILMRLALGRAHITVRGNGAQQHFAPSDEWLEQTEATEQAFVSYFLGSALAKLIAARLLRTPCLLHTSMYFRSGVVFDPLNRRRPDFIGERIDGGWTVVEAKGRKRRSSGLASSAKRQTEAIATINGTAPVMTVASIALFHKEELSIELVDPAPDESGIRLQVPPATALRLYYEPIIELLGEGARLEARDTELVIREFPELDLRVGLMSQIINQFSSDLPFGNISTRELLPSQVVQAGDEPHDLDEDNEGVGSDGVFIDAGASWWPAT